MKNRMIKVLMGSFLGFAMLSAFAGEFTETSKAKKTVAVVPKPLVNYDYFEQLVAEVKSHRQNHLVTLEQFLTEGYKKDKVILDTRSKTMYDKKHIKGAVHLNFADFTQGSLDSLFAAYRGKGTEIYIYCNNNFYDHKAVELDFQDPAFISKAIMPVKIAEPVLLDQIKSLALNIPTYINLYGYGYRNVFELNEMVDVNNPIIQFEGTDVQ